MSEFVRPQVNYMGIIDALIEVSRDRIERFGRNWRGSPAWEVQDTRTIGIMAGRQCGATEGALRWMAKHPNECILITKDSNLRTAHKIKYTEVSGRNADEFLGLVPSTSSTIEKWNERYITDEIKATTRYVIVDDAMFTIGWSGLKRPEFNQWVAETFHPETFVILIK